MLPGRGQLSALALVLFLVAPVGQLMASSLPVDINPKINFEELSERVVALLPFIGNSAVAITPQAVQQSGDAGPAVNPTRLDDPASLEQQLRAALRDPITETRLSVIDGTARLGNYSLGSAEVHNGHLIVLNGDAQIHGHLVGNIITLDGDITIHPGASVSGDVLAIGGRVRDVGAGITGTWSEMQATPGPVAAPTPILSLIGRRTAGLLGVFLTLTVLGLGLATFGRPNLEIVSDTVTHSFSRSFVVGLLGEILILPTFGMLLVGLFLTIAGALLVPFAAVVYVLLAIIAVLGGVLAVAHAMGETITRRRMARGLAVSPNSYRYLVTGLGAVAASWLAWVVFGWVPVAGAIALTAAVLGSWFIATVGFGAALLSRGGVREEFTGRLLPPAMMTDEYLWATPMIGVPAVERPPKDELK
jgi:hypothetical protein